LRSTRAQAYNSLGVPTETSKRLAKLNHIFELVNRNSVQYNRYSKTDSIYVDYKYTKLLKYQQYTDDLSRKFIAVDIDTGERVEFNPNALIPCTLENTGSTTVEGHPYCSRMSVSMSENQRNSDSSRRFDNIGGSNKVYDNTKQMVNILAGRFGIAKNTSGQFQITDRPIAETVRERQIAERLVQSANATLDVKNIASISAALNDPEIIEKRASELKRTRIRNISTRTLDNAQELAQANPQAASLAELGVNTSIASQAYSQAAPLSYEEVNSIASDLIKMAAESETRRFSDYDEAMDSFVNYNLVTDESAYPDMLLPDEQSQPDESWFNLSDELYNKEVEQNLLQKTWERRIQIGEFSSKHFNTSEPFVLKNKEGASEFKPAEWLPFPAPNPSSINNSSNRLESKVEKPFIQAPMDEQQQRVNTQRGVLNLKDKTYAMRRAMPTFKLYLREDDQSAASLSDIKPGSINPTSGFWRNFSDVYDMNAVVDIRLVKDEDNPVDMLVIRMTNTREDLVNRTHEIREKSIEQIRKEDQINRSSLSPTEKKKKLNDLDQDRLDGVILKEGTRVELRLGYENNPNNLSVEFSGRVADVSGGDVIEVMCQGDGVELVQELKGVGISDEFDWKSNTQDLISNLLHNSPEIQSFGTVNTQTALGEVSFLWDSAGGRSVIDNIFAPSLFGTWSTAGERALNYAGWGGLIGSVVPGLGTLIGTGVGALVGVTYGAIDAAFNGSPFYIYEQTIWDVLQELTMRHPGTICGVVPYDRRSTIFFGYPDQLYFFRGPTIAEKLSTGRSGIVFASTQRDVLEDKIGATAAINSSTSGLTNSETGAAVKPGDINLDYMKPYRSYHMITSEHDIVENTMMVTSDGVFNAIEVVYPNTTDEDEINVDGSKGFSEYKKYDTIQADDDLIKQYIKKKTSVYHNANTNVVEDLPERYAVSELCKSLQGVYKGKITILGRPGIKPHDIVFIEDDYHKINGPVKVSKVTQIFSYRTGWVTEIYPSMIVAPAGSTEMESLKAIQYTAKYYAIRNKKIFKESFTLDFIDEAEKRELSGINRAAQVLNSTAVNTATDVGATAAALSTARRAFQDGSIKAAADASGDFLRNVPSNSTSVQGLKNTFSGLKGGAGTTLKAGFKTFKWFGVGLALDFATSYYVSWSKQRQPIAFLPVFRNGKPWYTGMHGLKNNSEMEAIEESFNETVQEGGYLIDSVKNAFSDLFN
jgi:hypothetical protein